MATDHPSAAVASHALAAHFAPHCAAYQKTVAMAQKEARMNSEPALALRPDPILQSQQLSGADPAITELEMGVRRAEAMSRARRGE
jgi:hypothetical protein